MRDYKKLEVWKKSHEFNLYMYSKVLPKFPVTEKYDLMSQTKRSAYSITLNIVEGAGRYTEKDFAHFLDLALGSTHECEYCCLLAKDLSYLDLELFEKAYRMINEIKAMLIGLMKKLRE